ncbi:MAG: sensor domain-containing diguanylate cyclase, partial [Pseudomonadota bacterium]
TSLNEKTEELRFLYHLASQLSATLDPGRIAGIIGRALSKLVGASPVLFMTAFDPPGNLRCYPDRKINPDLAEDLAREMRSQFAGENNELKTESIIMETNSTRRLLVRKPKHKITLPLVTAGKQAGIMGVYFFRPPDLSRDRRLLLASVALQAAQALFNAHQHQNALNMAAHDPLTGLINRRAFDEILRREFKIFQRYGSVMSLIMIDLDHFKTINDRFGHEAGDQVLRTVARIIKDNVRDTDHAARVGGEEFAVILPNTEESEAWRLAIRIQGALRRTSFPLGQFPWRQTVSQGVADTQKTPVKDGENLLRLADQAMYMAKEEGRNRIRSASAPEFSGSGKEKRYAWQ